ncbi:MAG: glycoside hydrolase [Nitrospinota bacterium]|nr:glycoside hydrolase [Nitrospinota bacterium]
MDKKNIITAFIALALGLSGGYLLRGEGSGISSRDAARNSGAGMAEKVIQEPQKPAVSSLPKRVANGVNISDNYGSSIAPAIAIDKSGNTYAGWVETSIAKSEITIKKKKPGSDLWEPVNTEGLYGGRIMSLAMAADSKGAVHIAFRGKPEGEEEGYYAYYAKLDESGWSRPKNLSEGLDNVYPPTLVLDGDENIHVAWNVYFGHNAAIYYLLNEGGKWGKREPLSKKNNASDWLPSLFVDKNRVVHIVYHHSATEQGIEYRHKGKDGKWSEPVNIAAGTKFTALGRVVMDGKGVLHAFFLSNTGNGEDIFYTSRENGKWTEAAAITSTGKRSNVEKVLLDSKGRLHLFWNEMSGVDNYDIYYISGENGKWSDVVKLVETEANSLGYEIALTDSDKIGLVWQEGTRNDSDIFYAEIGNGGN